MVLSAHVESFRALDLWENPDFSGYLDSERLYELVLLATGDEEEARRAMRKRAEERMGRGEKP